MDNINSTATVNLKINGQQPQKVLQDLKQRAFDLENAIAKAANAGNRGDLSKLRREWKKTQQQIRLVQTETQNVELVMRRLDKATPKELSRTLATLNKQLQNMERGSAQWETQVNRIRQVKAEMARLNQEVALGKSKWTKFNDWMNNVQTSLLAGAAALAGLVSAGRNAVNAFAEMEEQMANTRKYTGLAEEQVKDLNKAFERIDTRTSRQQLNELAQEAGRLGKNTKEDVLGYVQAADIINVALVDLGAGATQTIAKLTNIFGVDKLMNTRDAMLSVGSTVNVLSQNCTASKPFLVEFAQRMAGIGAQASLSIPQILAFAATLDANGQKVEMSASALSRLIMMLFQQPRELAKQVGLDVDEFNSVLKKSTNEGLLMFLERLREIGEKDALASLAPLFKDLGMDGIRMSQVLANLATHLDMVKWEQIEANKAFKEASSASNEYQIFNNTTQAGIDKAKKRLHEIAVELGENLLPVMKHVMTSSSALLRFLNYLVNAVVALRVPLTALVSAFITYYSVVGIAWLKTKYLVAEQIAAKTASFAYAVSVNLISTAMALLSGNLQKAKAHLKLLNAAMIKSPIGLFIASVVALGVGIYQIYKNTNELKDSFDDAVKSADNFNESLVKEQHDLDVLFGKLESAEKGTKSYEDAKKAIINQYGQYLSGLIDEKGEIINLSDAYDRLSSAIRRSAQMRGISDAKEKIEGDYYKSYADNLNKLQSSLEAFGVSAREAANLTEQVNRAFTSNSALPKAVADRISDVSGFVGRARGVLSGEWLSPASITNDLFFNLENKNKALQKLNGMENVALPFRQLTNKDLEFAIKSLDKLISTAQKGFALVADGDRLINKEFSYKEALKLRKEYANEIALRGSGNDKTSPASVDTGSSVYQSSSSGKVSGGKASDSKGNKYELEDNWKDYRVAWNDIRFSTGMIDAEKYEKEKLSIEKRYNEKKLKNAEATEIEKLQFRAKIAEVEKQMSDKYLDQNVDSVNKSLHSSLAYYKQLYADGKISQKTYDEQVEALELEHLRALSNIYKNGSKEQLQAQEKYEDKLLELKLRKRKEYESKLDATKKEFFGLNASEREAGFKTDSEALDAVYRAELLAAGDNASEKLRIEEAYQKARLVLAKKYQSEELSGLMKANADFAKWIESDNGKAVVGAYEIVVSGMSSIFSQLSDMVQSNVEIETAAIEKRYEREISNAEGNSFKVQAIEKRKEDEIAKVKNNANKKMFAMQVIQAIAQTATNALNAYGSAAAIPLVGYILAPIAAAMAVSAGLLQVAAIKKQQQASVAKGYASGGFTKPGAIDEPAGIVHAGEWVASQKLVNNPKTRPLLDALDYAQKTNTIGSLTQSLASRNDSAIVASLRSSDSNSNSFLKEVSVAVSDLNKRLNEPFITVNTVTGDYGIKKAQDDYNKYIKNKTPKSRR